MHQNATGLGSPRDPVRECGERRWAAPAPAEAETGQDQQGPHQVELLLDGQGPGVAQRRGHLELGEVGLVGHDEVPVRIVEERGQPVRFEGGFDDVGTTEARVDGQHHQQEHDGGQEPFGPPEPERAQADGLAAVPLADQQSGDQEAREHEEEVDAEVAAVGPVEAEVVGHHPGHGQRPQSVEGGHVVVAARDGGQLDRDGLGVVLGGQHVDGDAGSVGGLTTGRRHRDSLHPSMLARGHRGRGPRRPDRAIPLPGVQPVSSPGMSEVR